MSLRSYIQDHPTPLVWAWEATAWTLRRMKPLFAKLGMETSSKIVKVPEEVVKGLCSTARIAPSACCTITA